MTPTKSTRRGSNFHKTIIRNRTMKIELNDTSDYKGGDLIYLTDGKVHRPEQVKGSITIHNNDIIHGVTPIVKGERYSLFILNTRRALHFASAPSTGLPERTYFSPSSTAVSYEKLRIISGLETF